MFHIGKIWGLKMQRRGEEGRRAGGGGDEEGRRVGESCRQLELRSECHQSPGTQEVGDGGMIFEGMYLFMSSNALPLAWEAVRVTFGDFLFAFLSGGHSPHLGLRARGVDRLPVPNRFKSASLNPHTFHRHQGVHRAPGLSHKPPNGGGGLMGPWLDPR